MGPVINFEVIDSALLKFAKERDTTVETQGITILGITPEMVNFRKISWQERIIGKAIIIKPEFSSVNKQPKWSFLITSWLEDGDSTPGLTPFWEQYLLQRVEFSEITQKIDSLLAESATVLASITKSNLQIPKGKIIKKK